MTETGVERAVSADSSDHQVSPGSYGEQRAEPAPECRTLERDKDPEEGQRRTDDDSPRPLALADVLCRPCAHRAAPVALLISVGGAPRWRNGTPRALNGVDIVQRAPAASFALGGLPASAMLTVILVG